MWNGSLDKTAKDSRLVEFKRVLGIDYGSRRVGLSLSDPLGITAQPVDAVKNDDTIWPVLKEIIRRQQVDLIVVGMPLNLKGQKARKAEEVERFIDTLKAETGVNVLTWDERFTTSMAQQTLLEMGTKRKERRAKGRVDSMAAAIILQSFLDSTKHSRSC